MTTSSTDINLGSDDFALSDGLSSLQSHDAYSQAQAGTPNEFAKQEQTAASQDGVEVGDAVDVAEIAVDLADAAGVVDVVVDVVVDGLSSLIGSILD